MKQNWRKRTEIEMKTTRKSLPNINLQPDETQKIRIMHRVLRSSYIEMKSVKIGTWKWETKPNEIETWIKTEEKHRNFKWKLQENHSTQVGLDSQNHNQAKLEPTKTDKPSKMKWKSWWRPKKITEFRDENSKKTTTHKWVWTRPPKTKPNWNQKRTDKPSTMKRKTLIKTQENHRTSKWQQPTTLKREWTHRIKMLPLDHVGQHYKHGDSQKPSQNLPWIHTHSANFLRGSLQNYRGKEGADEWAEKRRETGNWRLRWRFEPTVWTDIRSCSTTDTSPRKRLAA